ncbi:hypothetical protein BRC83_01195 [Halobacteriales archaeon QS_1_68_17]|nr:MAG: hypothetical protein BRC83_01195 [Halobacteriales archaeon QS_1_68_17]
MPHDTTSWVIDLSVADGYSPLHSAPVDGNGSTFGLTFLWRDGRLSPVSSATDDFSPFPAKRGR